MAIFIAHWALLQLQIPGCDLRSIGVLMVDHENTLHLRVRDKWWRALKNDGGEVWTTLLSDFLDQAREMGAKEFLNWLEMTASNTFQVTELQKTTTHDIQTALHDLYQKYVTDRRQESELPVISIPSRSFNFWRWMAVPAHHSPVVAFCLLGLILLPYLPKTESRQETFSRPILELPSTSLFITEVAEAPLLLDPAIFSRSELPKRQNRKRTSHKSLLKLEPVVVRPKAVGTQQIPPPSIGFFVSDPNPLQLAAIQIAMPPPFRNHGNGFVRMIKVLARPIRALVRTGSSKD